MSYYILPKNFNKCELFPLLKNEQIPIYASYSTYNYYNKSIKQLINICLFENNNTYDTISKNFNTYEYIGSTIPDINLSVSKLNQPSYIFYDFLELSSILNIFENFNNSIKSLIISPNFLSIIDSIKSIKQNINIQNYGFLNINSSKLLTNIDDKFNLIFCELDNDTYKNNNTYIFGLINILLLILKYQHKNGTSIIKIYNVYHKPIIDILYILSFIFEKVYVIKPNTSNIFSCDKYLVCKQFISDKYTIIYNKLNEITENNCYKNIHSLISSDIPYYFINKIDDMNIIICKQQIELIHQIINILKNKNKTDKLNILKNNNIQKCIFWCEKHNIPYNDYFEKLNAFVSAKQYNKIK